jgi:hypothetical protein
MKKNMVFLFLLLMFSSFVLAHGDIEEGAVEKEGGFFEDFLPVSYVIIILIIVAVPFLIIAFYHEEVTKQHIMFWVLIYIVSTITLIIVFDTVNLTIESETKGPVHWHADFQIWKCGGRLDVINPTGLSNRVGTRLFHEHNDNRVHVEGIVKSLVNLDLHNFFRVIGGSLDRNSFIVPTTEGMVEAKDGDLCNGEEAEVQIFLYKVTNAERGQGSGYLVEQLKVNEDYILSPYQDVPPGDCVIVEFDERKDKTERICETYKIALEQGDMAML